MPRVKSPLSEKCGGKNKRPQEEANLPSGVSEHMKRLLFAVELLEG